MQKKLIALAVVFAISAPAFADNANFTFYGTVDVSYDVVNTGDGTTTANGATAVKGVNKRVVSSNVSKFGFKGSEDLGDGLAAIWQIEQQINIDDAAKNTFASRNTFAGLKSETLGTVLLGIHDTPYKISTRKLDVFGDNIADNRALMGAPKTAALVAPSATVGTAPFAGASGAGFELRPSNVLAYISPAFAGVTAAIATANLREQNYTSAHLNDSALSLAVMYDVAPFYGSVAHESHKLDASVAADKSESASRLGFGFSQEIFSVGVVYEKTSDNFGAGGISTYGHNAVYVSGKMNVGQNAIKVAYTKAGQIGTIVNSGATQVAVGYDVNMSKRTKLYALYTKISNGKGINYGFSQNSGAASTNSGGFGTSPAALSFGLKHSF